MSQKRQATSELNPDNWDREDEQPVSCGTFRMAPEEELKGRVIKRARRKLYSDESGAGGRKVSGVGEASGGGGGGGGSEVVTSSGTTTRSTSLFGNFQGFTKSNSLTGTTSTTSSSTSSTVTASSSSPFRFLSTLAAKTTSSSNNNGDTPLVSSASNVTFNNTSTTISASSGSLLGFKTNSDVSGGVGGGKSIFAMSSSIKSEEQKKSTTMSITTSSDYYSKLERLNQTVSDWIKQHVDKNPLCILTPVFDDYAQHLKEIEKEHEMGTDDDPGATTTTTTTSSIKSKDLSTSGQDCLFKMPLNNNNNNNSIGMMNNNCSPFNKNFNETKSNGFSFGFKKDSTNNFLTSTTTATTTTTTTTTNGSTTTSSNPSSTSGFSFGLKTQNNNNNNNSVGGGFSFLSSFGQQQSSSGNNNTDGTKTLGSSGFRFGNVAASPPPSTSNNSGETTTMTDQHQEEKDEDEPPKVEFKQVVEENAIYNKKCKVFVKKDENFVDKGVGTLYLKPIDGSEKTQLIVRADTNLGNILLNFILNEGIPTKRTGKNNVMMVCIPTPEVEKATAVLVRVKTGEEADDLLKVINEHKK